MKTLFRARFLLIAAVCCAVAIGSAQQAAPKPNVTSLLAKLYSKEESERAKAFTRLRANPANLRNPSVRTALITLLDHENHELDAQLAEAQKKGYPDEGDNAAWAEYYSDLLDAVDSFADWNDARQACILVEASSSDDSAFAAKIADHAKVTVPCLMKRSKSPISINRPVSIPVLVQAIHKGKSTLDAGTVQSARRMVLDGLRDKNDAVRGSTVDALGEYGDADMISALRKVAETDPSPEVDGHSTRKAAAQAIAAIQKRAVVGDSRATPQR
jgi:hypothetical protein